MLRRELEEPICRRQSEGRAGRDPDAASPRAVRGAGPVTENDELSPRIANIDRFLPTEETLLVARGPSLRRHRQRPEGEQSQCDPLKYNQRTKTNRLPVTHTNLLGLMDVTGSGSADLVNGGSSRPRTCSRCFAAGMQARIKYVHMYGQSRLPTNRARWRRSRSCLPRPRSRRRVQRGKCRPARVLRGRRWASHCEASGQ